MTGFGNFLWYVFLSAQAPSLKGKSQRMCVNSEPPFTANSLGVTLSPSELYPTQQGRLWLFRFSFQICFYDLVVSLSVIDRMFISLQNSYAETPTPKVFGGGAFGRQLGQEGGVPINGISTPYK